MNGRIMNCAPGGARLANKVFPVPRLIPRRGNPREPLAAGIGRGKFYIEGLGGVRIEDAVVLKSDSNINLSDNLTKELIVL